MIRELSDGEFLEAMEFARRVHLAFGHLPISTDLARLSDFLRGQLFGLGLFGGLVLIRGVGRGGKLENSLGSGQDYRLQGQMRAARQYQIVEADFNFAVREKLRPKRRGAFLGRDAGNADHFAGDFGSRRDHELIECVYGLGDFSVNGLADFAEADFFNEHYGQRRACGTVSATDVSDSEVSGMEAGGELGADAGSGACPLLVTATRSTKRKIPKKRKGRRPVFIMGGWDASGCASVVFGEKRSLHS